MLSFNPFIPTRGVGIPASAILTSHVFTFQSIYTYKRRWNKNDLQELGINNQVSIHLYLQEALEYLQWAVGDTIKLSFNPFIPTRGVGIA